MRCDVTAEVPAPLDAYLAVVSVNCRMAISPNNGSRQRPRATTGRARSRRHARRSARHLACNCARHDGLLRGNGRRLRASANATPEAATAAARRVNAPSTLVMAAHTRMGVPPRRPRVSAIQSAEEAVTILGVVQSSPRTRAVSSPSRAACSASPAMTTRHSRCCAEHSSSGSDYGTRPQLSATLDWCLRPLIRNGDAEAAAVFVGVLEHGVPRGHWAIPGATARARTLERARAALGVDAGRSARCPRRRPRLRRNDRLRPRTPDGRERNTEAMIPSAVLTMTPSEHDRFPSNTANGNTSPRIL